MKIVVTGAAGHLGGRLSAHLAGAGHAVTGLDLKSADAPVKVHAADLSRLEPGWADRLVGQDAIVHFAADRAPDAVWTSVIPNNIDATLNLFAAARRAGVARFVFASSNWIMGGRRFGKERLDSQTVPCPVTPYGMSKLMGERIGAHYAAVHGMTVVCTRIGWTQWTHDNQPGPHMAMGRWGQLMWLSDRDFLDGMTAAATAPASGFIVLNMVSNNPGMRWSLDEARDRIGFSPRDGAPARLPLGVRLTEFGAWMAQVGVPRLMSRLTGASW